MVVACMSDGDSLDSKVPVFFEKSPYLIFIETANGAVKRIVEKSDEDGLAFVEAMIKEDVEVMVSGIIQKTAFEKIAQACITRCDGSGLSLLRAAKAAENNALTFIRDYEGGDGCGGHEETEECSCEDHLEG